MLSKFTRQKYFSKLDRTSILTASTDGLPQSRQVVAFRRNIGDKVKTGTDKPERRP